MAKYVAYLMQNGEGCDYTIGCGKKMITLESTDRESAEKELKDIIIEEYSDEVMLSSATIIEVSDEIQIDVKSIYNEKKENEKRLKDEKQKMKDLAEYERLKKQFGE